jgi:hypothetical protein
MNTQQTMLHNTRHDKRSAGCVLTYVYTAPKKGDPIRGNIPGSGHLSDR